MALAAMCVLGGPGVAAAAEKPNILFIFDDQHRKEATSCYGGTNIQTPNIDRLAREGMKFTNALSPTPLCTPYRGMLITGKFPTHSGLLVNFVNPQRNERGIADVFQQAGYHSGFIGKWHLTSSVLTYHTMIEGRERPHAPALDEPEYVPPGRGRLGFEYWAAFNFHMNFRQGFYYRDKPAREVYPDYEAEWMADDAIEFLKRHKASDRPFFLMVAPHYPHPMWRGEQDVPREALAAVPKAVKLRPNSKQTLPFEVEAFDGRSLLTLEEVRTYYAMCVNVDKNLGRILDCLDRTGLAANTIVVFTTDHGEQLGSQGRRCKLVPFEESINIPLLIRWPGHVKPGAVSDALYTPVDHMPTLCSLAGIARPNDLDGIDLAGEVLQSAHAQRDDVLIANYVSSANFCRSDRIELQWRGVRSKTHTYVKYLDGSELLFDNIADPYQMKNCIGDQGHRRLAESMRRRLQQLLAAAHDDLLPGTHYADWYDETRTVIRTGKGKL
jgi:arylsulfatase A-like enzyme